MAPFAEYLNAARLYEAAQRAYSAVPYRFFKGGYGFPAWHYYFEMTRRCNLRCKMCQYLEWLDATPGNAQKEGELTTEEWRRVIGQVHRFSLVTFTGGEPFVRADFPELLELAGRRARTHVITNATLLDEERARMLVGLAPKRLGGGGLGFLGTSIEAPGDLHDEIRRMPGAYQRSTDGIRALVRLRDAAGKACPMIHVTTVIQNDNLAALPLLPRAMKDIGANTLNLVTETRMHDLPDLGERDPARYKKSEVPFPRIERAALAQALDDTVAAARDAGIELRMPRMPREFLLDYYDGTFKLGACECRNAWNTFIIGRSGDAYPCWIWKAGNVREHSIRELWNNAEMRQFRRECQRHLYAMCPGCCFLEHKTDRDAVGK